MDVHGLWGYPAVRVATIVLGSLIAAKLVELVVRRTLVVLAHRTPGTLDDEIVAAVRRPLFVTVLLIGAGWAVHELDATELVEQRMIAVLETLAIVIWASALFRIGHAIFGALSRRSAAHSLIQPRTVPVFEMMTKLVIVGAAAYFIFLAWQLDVTGWLASAGIVGIAVGFAAKDTLANLFSGIFIVADAPYKVGDHIVLDGGLRGKVTHIGIRSTCVLTIDDVEITVPNALIGASKIINENGGPFAAHRVGVPVEVAYGSDIDKVRDVLLACPTGLADIVATPTPTVRLRELGSSGLKFELLVWITDGMQRGVVVDKLNCAIYKAFAAAKIEIPHTKHDVFVRMVPAEPVTARGSLASIPDEVLRIATKAATESPG